MPLNSMNQKESCFHAHTLCDCLWSEGRSPVHVCVHQLQLLLCHDLWPLRDHMTETGAVLRLLTEAWRDPAVALCVVLRPVPQVSDEVRRRFCVLIGWCVWFSRTGVQRFSCRSQRHQQRTYRRKHMIQVFWRDLIQDIITSLSDLWKEWQN